MDPAIAEFASKVEAAASRIQQPGSEKERFDAELFLIRYHESVRPYDVARHVLENSFNEVAIFHVLNTVKAAILREWPVLEQPLIEWWRDELILYVINKERLPGFCRNQALHIVAIIFKRQCVQEFQGVQSIEGGAVGSIFLDRLSKLLDLSVDSPDLNPNGRGVDQHVWKRRSVGVQLCFLLVEEFDSISPKTSSLGVPMHSHVVCHRWFEKHILVVFQLCFSVILRLLPSV